MTVVIGASKKVGPGKATSRCRTSLSRHPDAEMQRARLQPLTTSLSDLVAYGGGFLLRPGAGHRHSRNRNHSLAGRIA